MSWWREEWWLSHGWKSGQNSGHFVCSDFCIQFSHNTHTCSFSLSASTYHEELFHARSLYRFCLITYCNRLWQLWTLVCHHGYPQLQWYMFSAASCLSTLSRLLAVIKSRWLSVVAKQPVSLSSLTMASSLLLSKTVDGRPKCISLSGVCSSNRRHEFMAISRNSPRWLNLTQY